ncbi:MAG: hypothetical protein V1834_02280 [Candidatus Micrarchaeota archaeon]
MPKKKAESMALIALGTFALTQHQVDDLARQLIDSHAVSEVEGRKIMRKIERLVEGEREAFLELAGYNRDKVLTSISYFDKKIAKLERELNSAKKKRKK